MRPLSTYLTEPDQVLMNASPDALLLIAPGCPHCQAVFNSLSELLKKGEIGRLEVVNIAVHPEAAQKIGTRSVPWTRIGPFELAGNYSLGELRKWVQQASDSGAGKEYIRELLEQQQLEQAVAWVKEHPAEIYALLELMQEEEGSFTARLGVAALLEELAGSDLLRQLVPRLEELAHSAKAGIRGDAAHYLGLSGSADAIPVLRSLLDDPQEDVREIARDSLTILEASR